MHGALFWVSLILSAVSFEAANLQRFDRRWWESNRDLGAQFTRLALHANPNPRVPLAKLLEFETNKPVRARIMLADGASRRLLFESNAFSRQHSLPVLGLRPARRETIHLIVIDLQGAEVEAAPIEIETNPLPRPFPSIEATISDPGRMEPGVTLFNLSTPTIARFGLLIAVNERGEVVWYYQADKGIGDARRLRNGNLLLQDAAGVLEIDMFGNTVRRWQPDRPAVPDVTAEKIPIAVDFIHHEVHELPSGDFLALSLELRRLGNYPSSETNPNSPAGDANVIGDGIVEYRPDGSIIRQWSLFDILDPMRIGFGSLGTSWNQVYPEAIGGTRDWSHGNAVIHDASDDSLIVSLRHQDAVIKIERTTGALKWILGNHDGWTSPWNRSLLTPIGDLEWPYHQHAPHLTPNGTILLFDNGNFRRSPFDGKPTRNFSRVVEFSVDSQNMTVSQVWSWGGPTEELFFSSAVGDADWLPLTGNVLVTDGFRNTDDIPTRAFVRLVELTHTTPAEKVFELIARDAPGLPPAGWRGYRSERLPSLYPNQD